MANVAHMPGVIVGRIKITLRRGEAHLPFEEILAGFRERDVKVDYVRYDGSTQFFLADPQYGEIRLNAFLLRHLISQHFEFWRDGQIVPCPGVFSAWSRPWKASSAVLPGLPNYAS